MYCVDCFGKVSNIMLRKGFEYIGLNALRKMSNKNRKGQTNVVISTYRKNNRNIRLRIIEKWAVAPSETS